jgi:hypothetical protein
MMSNKALLLTVLAVVVVVATAYEFPVNVYLMGEQHAQHRIARNVVANPLGQPNNFVQPIEGGTVQYPTAIFDLNDGDWELTINEPGFYSYKDVYTINSTTYVNGGNMFLLPTSSGVTVFTHPYVNPGLMWANMTVPTNVFNFGEHISARQPGQLWNFGVGTPPAQLWAFPYRMYLSSAQNGTYRYYQEVKTQNGTMTSQNFTNNAVKVSVFAGTSQNGYIGTFKSTFQDALAWYVGDIVVTNPNDHCSIYRWQNVNTYSSQGAGFDKTDHGNGDVIIEECSTITPATLSCAEMLVDESEPTHTCGAFGDPHIIIFNGTGVTCGNEVFITLIDNEYFSLTADTQLLNDSNGATAISSVTFTYKTPCNPITLNFNNAAVLNGTLINAPLAYRHRIRFERNNIFLDALHVRIQVRQVQGTVVFGLSMPESLIAASTGICADSCPGNVIDLASSGNKRDAKFSALAADVCSDAGLSPSSFEYQACIFDVATSGNTAFAATATAITAVRTEVAIQWNAPPLEPSTTPEAPETIPETVPDISQQPTTAQPNAGAPSDSDNPTSIASGLVPSALFAALLVLIALLF